MSRVTDPERVYSAEELAAAAPPDEPEPAPAPDETLTAGAAGRERPPRRARDRRDRQLVRRLKQGDEAAVPRAGAHLSRTGSSASMLRMIGNRQEAEDLAQEVFIIVYRAIGNYRGEGRFYTWLYRVATNTCKNRIKYLKGRNFHRSLDIDETPQAQMPAAETGAVITFQSQVPGPEAVDRGHADGEDRPAGNPVDSTQQSRIGNFPKCSRNIPASAAGRKTSSAIGISSRATSAWHPGRRPSGNSLPTIASFGSCSRVACA